MIWFGFWASILGKEDYETQTRGDNSHAPTF